MKKLLGAILLMTFCISCNRPKQEIIHSFANGKPQLIYYTKKIDGNKVRVSEELFYENGNLRQKGKYSLKNQRTGKWKFYFENGDLFASADFTKNPNGEKWKIFRFHSKKPICEQGKLSKVQLSEAGNPIFCQYSDGENAWQYIFYESFDLMLERQLHQNVAEGLAIGYHQNGEVSTRHSYKNGVEDGSYELFYDNGNIRIKGDYKNGVKQGTWTYYDRNGKQTQTQVFDANGNSSTKTASEPIYLDKDGKPIE